MSYGSKTQLSETLISTAASTPQTYSLAKSRMNFMKKAMFPVLSQTKIILSVNVFAQIKCATSN